MKKTHGVSDQWIRDRVASGVSKRIGKDLEAGKQMFGKLSNRHKNLAIGDVVDRVHREAHAKGYNSKATSKRKAVVQGIYDASRAAGRVADIGQIGPRGGRFHIVNGRKVYKK